MNDILDDDEIMLAFEASAGCASVAVMARGAVLAECRHDAAHGHGGHILPLAERCLGESGVGMERITAVLAGRGPGSFTGVRVALAAAKGLALARGIGGYGIGSLAALGAMEKSRPLAVVADTRRKGLVYLQSIDAGGVADEARIMEYGTARGAISAGNYGKIIGNVEIPGVEVSFAEPMASHLCHAFIAAKDREDMPLEPIYITEPLLGPR